MLRTVHVHVHMSCRYNVQVIHPNTFLTKKFALLNCWIKLFHAHVNTCITCSHSLSCRMLCSDVHVVTWTWTNSQIWTNEILFRKYNFLKLSQISTISQISASEMFVTFFYRIQKYKHLKIFELKPFSHDKKKHRFLETNFTSADCLSYHPMRDCFYKLSHDTK